MNSSEQILLWLNELRKGKKFQPDSVLISKVSKDCAVATSIKMLDVACCTPPIVISKPHQEIVKDDLLPWLQAINHSH